MKGQRSLRIVIKLGSSSIVDEKSHEPILSNLSLIMETAVKLRREGHKVVIVSSGAIAVGLRRMDVERRPKQLSKLQALAAIGQCQLLSLWDSLFTPLRQPIAQILLTRNDIADRTRYFNAQNTFNELFDMGVIPIVNENDTLAVAEIKFGDNDTLSAFTAAMVHADVLFLMTDVDCLYDKNPRTHPDAQAIDVVEDINKLQADVSSAGSAIGTGGMSTKIVAARLATSAGVTTIITKASKPGNIAEIVQHLQGRRSPASPLHTPSGSATMATDLSDLSGHTLLDQARRKLPLHTRFVPSADRIRDRSFWILHGLKPHGTLYIDTGAHRALVGKAGLLPVGVVHVEGNFAQQEAVSLVVVDKRAPITPGEDGKAFGASGVEVGRAIVNYAAVEIARIKGHQSTEIEGLLGYADSEYVAPRENISLIRPESRPTTPLPTTPLGNRENMEVGGIAIYENMG